jgi:hypothetical protein
MLLWAANAARAATAAVAEVGTPRSVVQIVRGLCVHPVPGQRADGRYAPGSRLRGGWQAIGTPFSGPGCGHFSGRAGSEGGDIENQTSLQIKRLVSDNSSKTLQTRRRKGR